MYLGVDLGTSSVKTVLIDEAQNVLNSASQPLAVSRPHPGWSEQNPEDWWTATLATIDELKTRCAKAIGAVRSIGLSGQQHGATLLDKTGRPLRPCMLWNDGRAQSQCEHIETTCPDAREISGNVAMPGFTAPKVLWVKQNEPEIFSAIHKVLLPKDYVRFCLSGEYFSDVSDSSGTFWLDVAKRDWSHKLLAATDLTVEHMPELAEGSEAAGRLKPDLAKRWDMQQSVVIAGGGGDNAASACGIGAINPDDAFISLGTSGVMFASNASFAPNPAGALHAFCHAVPNTWHQMGVILSASSCFDWFAGVAGCNVGEIYDDLNQPRNNRSGVLFLPYLSGERTPHNDTSMRGTFAGLSHSSTRHDLSHAVAQGVAYAFRDCLKVLSDAGTSVETLVAVGGGSRSQALLQILADVLGKPVCIANDSEAGAAFGAARLAITAHTGAPPGSVMTKAPIEKVYEPRLGEHEYYESGWLRYRALALAVKQTV